MAKEQKKGGRTAEFNPEFVYSLSVDVFRRRLNRVYEGGYKGYLEMLSEKYGDEERAKKRLEERSQLTSSEVRSVLRGLREMGDLPEEAGA